jgi:AAHS family 3-hydroxyphenylpropionic acid transporter
VSTFFPVYLQDLGYSAFFISWIVTLQRSACLLASVAGGGLSDTLGPKRTLVAGQCAYFIGILLFVATGAGPIALIWAIFGAGMGMTSIGSQSYLMEKSRPGSLGLLTALYNWGYTLGGAASAPVAGFLLAYTGYRGLTPLMAIPAVATLVVSAGLVPPSRRPAAVGTRSPRALLARLLDYGGIAARPEIRLLAALRFLPTFCYGMLLVFVPLLLKSAGGSNELIALYAAASSICASLCQLLVGRLADRVSWKAPTIGSFSVLAAGAAGIAAFSGSLWPVFACATAAIAAAWSLSTLLPTLIAKASPGGEQGRILGFAQLFWNLAMISSGLVGGLLFEAWKSLPFLAGAVASACAIVVARSFFAATNTAPAAPGAIRPTPL